MSASPLVWVLHGHRAGDNAQTVALAEALGWSFQTKQLRYNALHHLPFWLRGAGLASLDRNARASIAPPWPDLVIAIGKRSVPIALHIRRAAGGRTRLVHLGRPRAPLSLFDLVLTTPQYGLPPTPNLIELPLPFTSTRVAPGEELARWSAEWRDLPRPLIAVLIGSAQFPLLFDKTEAQRLAASLARVAGQASLVLLGSPRSDRRMVEVIAEQLGPRALACHFDPANNPYRAALTLADHVVVTSDSMSMLADALLAGKPVSIHQLPVARLSLRWSASNRLLAPLARRGWLMPPRNMAAVARHLVESGAAGVLGAQVGRGRPGPSRMLSEHESALRRVRELVVDAEEA
jgi:uncharacterized protein